jgi:hypothetical protein
MLWQLVIVAALILVSAAYLGWQSFKTWSAKGGCGGGCHCSSKKPAAMAPALISENDLTARLRHHQG